MNEKQIEQIKRLIKDERATNFVNVDNEIFKELQIASNMKLIKSVRQQSFAFSYLWLTSYLWKYSKYKSEKFDTKDIKETLGLYEKEKTVDYLIKRNGILDKLKYTETTRNFPIDTIMKEDGIEVLCLSNLSEDMRKAFLSQYHTRYFCKKPLSLYERTSGNGENKDGLLFSDEDSLKITIQEFTKIIVDDNNVNAFQVYAYLKMRSKLRGYTPVRINLKEIGNVLGCSVQTIMRNTKALKELGMIDSTTECISVGGKVSKENSYTINKKYQN